MSGFDDDGGEVAGTRWNDGGCGDGDLMEEKKGFLDVEGLFRC